MTNGLSGNSDRFLFLLSESLLTVKELSPSV